MKVASSGSRRAISSASRRMRAQTGSTFSSPPALTCCWAMIISASVTRASLAHSARRWTIPLHGKVLAAIKRRARLYGGLDQLCWLKGANAT